MNRLTGRRTDMRMAVHRAFSLVELLVVIAIIGILLSVVYKGGGALLATSKARDTEGMFQTLEQAIASYESEAGQLRIPYADKVFHGAPPDDLDVFASGGSSTAGCPLPIAMAAGSPVLPNLIENRDSSSGALDPLSPSSRTAADVRAMLLAMRLRSPNAAAILDRIDQRFKEVDNYVYDPNDGSAVIPLAYLVDAWGTPIEYFSSQACPECSTSDKRSVASDAFVTANNGEPLLVSYGPNGEDQYSAEYFSTEGDTTLVADYFDGDPAEPHIDSPLNADNVYSSEIFVHRMGEDH